jgi:hypothetical protein
MNIGGWEGLSMSTRWLGMLLGLPHFEVAGWGGIYSHQPKSSRWWSLLAKGAPDSVRCATVQCPMRRHVILPLGLGAGRPLEALSSCGTGQSGVPPDSPVPLWLLLWHSEFHCSLCRVDHCAQIAVAPLAHRIVWCATGHCPVLHRTVWWIIAEVRLGNPKVKSLSWFTLVHRTVRCARPGHTSVSFLLLTFDPNLFF